VAGEHVLITGGSGFIGTAVVRGFVDAGYRVTAVDQTACSVGGVASVTGDLRDERVRERAFRDDVSGVVHLAAATSVVGSMSDPLSVLHDNVSVTAALLELARTRGAHRFVMSSTNAVVGEVGDLRIHPEMPLRPLTPYGATKAAGEMLLSAYASSYGMSTCALRLTNVYGPGMGHKDSFVARLMRAARAGTGVHVYGDGRQRRDFVYVTDVVAAMLQAWRASATGTLIVGSGTSVTMLDLIDRVRRVTDRPLPVEHAPARPGEMTAVIVDLAAIRRLGYEPSVGLDEGLTAVWKEAAVDWASQPG
jgi:UDP-glucose 4-epimerase